MLIHTTDASVVESDTNDAVTQSGTQKKPSTENSQVHNQDLKQMLKFVEDCGYEETPPEKNAEDNLCEQCNKEAILYIREYRGMEDSDCSEATCLDCTYRICKIEEQESKDFDVWLDTKCEKCNETRPYCMCGLPKISTEVLEAEALRAPPTSKDENISTEERL